MMTSPNPGQEKKEKKKKEYDQKHFLPVTIRQVMGCTTEPPTIDGTEIYYVKIVGCIKSKDEQSTAINYAIEDGTGIIDAKEWVNDKDGASAAARREKIVSNVYVRAFGMIRTFNGTTSLQCYHISMLADVNEMTSHYLETILTHEKVSHIYFYIPIFLYSYIPIFLLSVKHFHIHFHFHPHLTLLNPLQNTNPALQQNNAALFGQSALSAAKGGNISMNVNNGEATNLDACSNAVLDYIKNMGEESEMGADLKVFIKENAGKMDEKAIMSAANKLAGDGMIYSTVDEETFKYAL